MSYATYSKPTACRDSDRSSPAEGPPPCATHTREGVVTPLALLAVSQPVVLQSLTSPLVIGGLALVVITALVAVAVAVLLKRRGGSDSGADGTAARQSQSQQAQSGSDPPAQSDSTTSHGSSDVDAATLDRLDGLVPEAVRAVRNGSGGGAYAGPEQRLYAAIEAALDDGALDMAQTSPYGEPYEIVNLPTRLRELELTQFSGRYHLGELDGLVRDWIADDDVPLRDLSVALSEMVEHKRTVSDHIRSRESEFERRVEEIRADLDDITAVTEQLDGEVGDRFRVLVVENRHPEVTGVSGIETGIDEAKIALHRCAFDEAIRQLEDCKRDADDLLTAVDFFRSFIGGIEHGQRSAQLPNEAATQLCLQLTDLLEQQYDIGITHRDDRLLVEGEAVDSPTQRSLGETTGETGSEETSDSTGEIQRVQPEEITDEILYILRELKRQPASEGTIELQTEQLPENIAQPAVLRELASFCGRRSDVVDEVTLQDGAPPGFLEVRFAETTTADAGLDTLADAFADRYASNS